MPDVEGWIRNAATGIVVKDQHLLMIREDWPRPDTFFIPGGGQRPGETLAECAEREVFEETGVRVKAERLVVLREYIPARHQDTIPMLSGSTHRLEAVFWCEIVSEPAVLGGHNQDGPQTGTEWMPISKLGDIRLLPPSLPSIIHSVLNDPVEGAVYLGDDGA
ncbi:NUDIX domain-containing protein [Streptomyces sp. NPDC000405]|uniref:NUDIX domain-containing protein n=1 Tax=Streptomyces sp. NPDC000405 TaxID=3161033 RepID=UPI00398C9085